MTLRAHSATSAVDGFRRIVLSQLGCKPQAEAIACKGTAPRLGPSHPNEVKMHKTHACSALELYRPVTRAFPAGWGKVLVSGSGGVSAGGRLGRSIKRRGQGDCRAGGLDGGFQFCQVRLDFVEIRPALEIEADHLIGPQRGLASGPQMDQQAGDDGAVSLNLNPHRIGAEQVPAAENVLEEAEEQLDGPAVLVNVSDHFRRDVEQVGGYPQDAIAGGARDAAPLAPRLARLD